VNVFKPEEEAARNEQPVGVRPESLLNTVTAAAERFLRPPRRNRHRAAQAASLGLRYVSSRALELRRRKRGRGFSYHDADGGSVRGRATVKRISALAIPPAWTNVRVAADANAHIQAVGTDQAGRLQYIYHPRWKMLREWRKVRRMLEFADALPRVRAGILRDLKAPAGSQRLALAVGAGLIDASAIRIGGERHHRRTGACGAVTLRRSHVQVNGRMVRLCFPAKGGKEFRCDLESPRLTSPIRRLSSLPGRRLLVYRNDDGAMARLQARHLNEYLTELAGHRISAKDFRTFQATALAGDLLAEMVPAETQAKRDRQIAGVMREIADHLGNTPALARNSYVHELVLACFAGGTLAEQWNRSGRRPALMEAHEAALARLLKTVAPAGIRKSSVRVLVSVAAPLAQAEQPERPH
jgi:DNA topoisomerase-1